MSCCVICWFFFFFQAEDGIRDYKVTGVQTCALPIYRYAQDVQDAHDGEGGGQFRPQVLQLQADRLKPVASVDRLGVQGEQLSREPGGRVVVQHAGGQHDPLLQQSLVQSGGPAAGRLLPDPGRRDRIQRRGGDPRGGGGQRGGGGAGGGGG